MHQRDVVIIGGGIAGLCNAIRLADAGVDVCVIERKQYPYHKVCGEYISNETLPYLTSLSLDVTQLQPARINRLQLSSPGGRALSIDLDLGGFGISRYAFDNFLYENAMARGVEFMLETQVNDIHFADNIFTLTLSNGEVMEADLVIGAFGKRSKLDRVLDRDFFRSKSPYIGVKYHIRADFPRDTIALYNFEQGYCGINAIEEDKLCLCYLTKREQLKKHGTIGDLEAKVLHKNPLLKRYFTESEMLYSRPEVINEISFRTKEAVKEHVLMSGDAAGMIAPLCGNGMAMAMHSAKICAECVIPYAKGLYSREEMEQQYVRQWQKLFATRLWAGRQIQQLFGKVFLSEIAVGIGQRTPALTRWLIKQTHGSPF